METASSEGLLLFHSSDEFTGGFLTTWGELESEGGKKRAGDFSAGELKQRITKEKANKNVVMRLNALGVPVSLALLFFRRGFSGTWTWSTWDTLFCVLAEGRADLSDTGDMSDFVDRLSLKYLDTETTER